MSTEQTMAESGNLPNAEPSYLTPSRMELADWMRGYAPSLTELYLGALRMMHDPSIPGRVVLICHAVREICNRLPGRVSGEEAGGRLDYTRRIDVIAKVWSAAGLPLDGAVPISADITTSPVLDQTPAAQVPSYVFVPVAELVRDHLNGRAKPEETAMRLFQAAAPETGAVSAPALAQWLKTREWFVAHAHDSGRLDADVDKNELEAHFGIFEQTLLLVSPDFLSSDYCHEIELARAMQRHEAGEALVIPYAGCCNFDPAVRDSRSDSSSAAGQPAPRRRTAAARPSTANVYSVEVHLLAAQTDGHQQNRPNSLSQRIDLSPLGAASREVGSSSSYAFEVSGPFGELEAASVVIAALEHSAYDQGFLKPDTGLGQLRQAIEAEP